MGDVFVEVLGATLKPAVETIYGQDGDLNGRPLFRAVEDDELALFFGQRSFGGSKGWFISRTLPEEEQVEQCLIWNPSASALLPSQCVAGWETCDGRIDVNMNCLEVENWDSEEEEDEWEDDDDDEWEYDEDEDGGSECDDIDAESIKECFRKWDLNGDRLMDKCELKSAFKKLGSDLSEDEIDTLLGECDANNDGCIDYNEFVDWIVRGATGAGDENAELVLESIWEGDDGEDDEDLLAVAGDDIEETFKESSDGHAEDGFIISDETIPFLDDTFPASEVSLGVAEGDSACGLEAASVDNWMRLPTTTGAEEAVCLFKAISPRDVVQGDLGNCWFLAACASVAEYPSWIRHIFGSQTELSGAGRYQVRLFHPGKSKFVWITIDDQVPCCEGAAAYASVTEQGEIWVCLLEKAFAKLCGSYSSLEGGSESWGMLYLSGSGAESWNKDADTGLWMPSFCQFNGGLGDVIKRQDDGVEEFIESDSSTSVNAKQLWAKLLEWCGKAFALGCGITEERSEMYGLFSGHAYSLITVREIHVEKKRCTLQLVKVRNPHGENEWEGRWSDKSNCWKLYPSVKNAIHFKPNDDGSFWMSFKDFVKFFDNIDIVKKSMPLQGCHRDKLEFVTAARKAAREGKKPIWRC